MASDIDKRVQELRKQPVESNSPLPSHTPPSSKEYVHDVSQWLDMYRAHYMTQYNMMVGPYYMAMGYAQASCAFTNRNGHVTTPGPCPSMLPNGAAGGSAIPPLPPQNQHANQGLQAGVYPPNGGQIIAREFIIPSIYRRVGAELIDFILLFSLKLTITMYAITYFGIVDQTSFALKFLAEEIDEDPSMEDLQQVLAIAVVYRSIVCIYETLFLAHPFHRDTLGGATPGKYLMGLRTISLERVQTLGSGRVQVTLPDDLTYIQAFGRAIIKNFSMAFFFPACITMFFNPHLRATYDIITKTMVVSADQNLVNDVNNNRNPGR